MKRQEYNQIIFNELRNYLSEHSDIRFIQALYNLNIVDNEDRFYEESQITLERMGNILKFQGTLYIDRNKDNTVISIKSGDITHFNLEAIILNKFQGKKVSITLLKDQVAYINLQGIVNKGEHLNIGNEDLLFNLLPYKGQEVTVIIKLILNIPNTISENKILKKENELLKKKLYASTNVVDKLTDSEKRYLDLVTRLNTILGEKFNGCSQFSVKHLLNIIENMNNEHLNPNLINDLKNEIQFKNQLIESIITQKQGLKEKIINWFKEK